MLRVCLWPPQASLQPWRLNRYIGLDLEHKGQRAMEDKLEDGPGQRRKRRRSGMRAEENSMDERWEHQHRHDPSGARALRILRKCFNSRPALRLGVGRRGRP